MCIRDSCGGEVVHKVKSQWMLKITEYAQRLLDDLQDVDYFDRIKATQINWIGRSTGAEVDLSLIHILPTGGALWKRRMSSMA